MAYLRFWKGGHASVELRRPEGRSAVGADGNYIVRREGFPLSLAVGPVEGVCGPPQILLVFGMKMSCFDALWNTVLKLMCLQQKFSHKTSPCIVPATGLS